MKAISRRLVSVAAVAALLFAQLAVAAYACPGDVGASVPAATVQAMPGCEGMGTPAPLCASHCSDGAQSFEKPANAGVAPAVMVGTIEWHAIAPVAPARVAGGPRARATPPPGPPLSIRNCCLRI